MKPDDRETYQLIRGIINREATSSKRISPDSNSDSDLEEEKEEKKKPLSKTRKACSTKTRTVVKSKNKNEKKDEASTDEEEGDDKDKTKRTWNVWAEVYVESKESWISVNVMDGNVDCVAEVYVSSQRNSPCDYLLACLFSCL